MMFSQHKLPTIAGITAVYLILIVLTTSACDSAPDSVRSAALPTPVSATNTPPPTETAVISPINETLPTPSTQFRHNAEQVLFAPGSSSANLGNNLEASEIYLYTLYGLAGQRLTVNITVSDNAMSFTILDANNQELGSTNGSRSMSATLPTDGDCFIKVEAPHENGRRYEYSLEIILTKRQAAPAPTTFDGPAGGQPTSPPTTIPPAFSPTPFVQTAVPQPEPITFEPEKTTTTISGQLDGSTGKKYLLPAFARQLLTMYANASQPGIIVSIVGRDNTTFDEFRSGETFSELLPTTQDYFIYITSQATNTSLDYSLTIAVGSPPPSPDPEPITFNAGSNSADFNDILLPDNGKTYVLNGSQGQTLLIDTTPVNSNITISVRGADGTMLDWTTVGIQFSAVLPASQDYFITLMPSADATSLNYLMTVTVR